VTQPSPPPPGWYPDPYGGGGQRYWDGRAWLTTPPMSAKPRKSSPLKILLIIGAAVFLLLGGCVAFVAVIAGSGGTNKGTTASTHQPSAQDLDPSNYQPISSRDYALLVKNPDAAKGRKLIVYGVVTQFDPATGTSDFRANTGADNSARIYDYDENTLLHAPDPAILKDVVEKDMVTMYVDVVGSQSYDTQIGGHTTAPLFNVYIIKVNSSG